MNRCLLAVCCGLAAAAPLAAQGTKVKHPKRPAEATSANADTNSALNYSAAPFRRLSPHANSCSPSL